jgi:ribosomal protein S12
MPHYINFKGYTYVKQFRSKTPAFKGCPQRRGTVIRVIL